MHCRTARAIIWNVIIMAVGKALSQGLTSHAVVIFVVGYLEQGGMEILNHSLSYRYGGTMEMDPTLKLGALQS